MNLRKTRTWSTPLVIGSGLFVSLSGLAMFAGLELKLKFAHEWLGLVFATGIFFHIGNHFTPFKRYFQDFKAQHVMAWVASLAAILLVLTFTLPDQGEEGLAKAFSNSSIEIIAPVIGKPVEEIVDILEKTGLQQVTGQKTLGEIAELNSSEADDLMDLLVE
ncbi:MAG: hypothetical protein MI743_00365 [Sneathiellales bacterium]|nr:hypothetical protein [Sneathiellales bacterium]